MNNKEVVSTAIKEVEKEKQEREISKIKDIVKAILTKIESKEKEVKERQEELRALKADLDDLKAGRLDKIEERQGKDPVHDRVTIILVKPVPEQFIPYQPWKSPWIVEWSQPAFSGYSSSYGSVATSWGDLTTITTCTGSTWQNFTTGTYDIGGHIINL